MPVGEVQRGHSPVDYDRVSDRYHRGRALSSDSMGRWRDAVAVRLPDGPLGRVGDIGAGDGLFIPMWIELGAKRIIAVEPSAAMRARAVERVVDRVSVVAASASAVPLASSSVDALWLSAVVHHFPDLVDAAVELGRVLRPDGRCFVRQFIPGRSTVPWLDHLPGAERARARFPTLAHLTDAVDRAGLAVRDAVEVPEPEGPRASDAADWVEAMRAADSLLVALSDDEIARGVASLRHLGDTRLEPLALTLITAGHPGSSGAAS